MTIHQAVEGVRHPPTDKKDPRSAYEIVCACGCSLSAYAEDKLAPWDAVLDQYLDHLDEAAAVAA